MRKILQIKHNLKTCRRFPVHVNETDVQGFDVDGDFQHLKKEIEKRDPCFGTICAFRGA